MEVVYLTTCDHCGDQTREGFRMNFDSGYVESPPDGWTMLWWERYPGGARRPEGVDVDPDDDRHARHFFLCPDCAPKFFKLVGFVP